MSGNLTNRQILLSEIVLLCQKYDQNKRVVLLIQHSPALIINEKEIRLEKGSTATGT